MGHFAMPTRAGTGVATKALALRLISLCALAFLPIGCASGPAIAEKPTQSTQPTLPTKSVPPPRGAQVPAAPPQPAPPSLPDAAEQSLAPRSNSTELPLRRVLPPKERVDYLEASLADYVREVLPNGVTIAVKRQEGRRAAAARISLARDPGARAEEAGFEALALQALESDSPIQLKLEDSDDIALELACPLEGLDGLLARIAASLASPSVAQEGFDRALREARVAERRESGDPLLRAAAELRSGLYAGHPYGLPPRGTAASLASATRESVLRYWTRSFDPARLTIAVVCDEEPASLAASLASSFGALPRSTGPSEAGGSRAGVDVLPIRPWFRAVPLSATPGAAVLRGEFSAPPSDSPDYPAMIVALAMLDDLLQGLRAEGGLADGAWAGLSSAAAPSASVTVFRTPDPRKAKAAVDKAIAELASGSCLDSATGGLAPIAGSLEAYEGRAIAVSYARLSSPGGMAARIARDIAAGGDGTAAFRLAGRVRAVRVEDVERVVRERLLEGPSAWVALGDPELVLGLPSAAFVR